jgi:hypothetical protein
MIPPFIPHSVKLKSESSCFIDGCISNVDAMCFRTVPKAQGLYTQFFTSGWQLYIYIYDMTKIEA